MNNNNKLSLITAYLKFYKELKFKAFSLSRKKEVAEDIMQELYFRLLKWPANKEIANPRAFLYTSVHNGFFNHHSAVKREIKRKEKIRYISQMITDDTDDACNCMQKAYRLDLVAEFTNTLPKVQKQVFTGILQSKSVQEIAKNLGNKYNTVKHNKLIIVGKLREFLKQRGEDFTYGI